MTAESGPPVSPLFEDDLGAPGVIDPARVVPRNVTLPPVAVMCWFADVVADLAGRDGSRVAVELVSEAGRAPVHVVTHRGVGIAVVQPGVGAPFAAMVLEELVALGVRAVVGCGGAGALVPDLVLGHAVVVDSAVRDEGTSAHYLPPGRVVETDPALVQVLVDAAHAAGVEHLVGRAWTTDALFRETRARTDRRVAEGCVAVEMEAAALLAVARFRGVGYAQYLMAGDTLAGERWDSRGWTTATTARAELATLALDAAARLAGRVEPPARMGTESS